MNVTVCFHLDLNYLDSSEKGELDRVYQNGLKKLLKVLYSSSDFLISISIPGAVLDYYSERFPEAVELLKELVARSQVEILGGGYHAPILPLLQPADRSGQIEKMTTLLRSLIGKRPRGLSLYGSIWDDSLIQPLKACGFDYVFLDESLVSDSLGQSPLIVSEYGKSIRVLVVRKSLVPLVDEDPSAWMNRLSSSCAKSPDESTDVLCCVELDMDSVLRIADRKFLSVLLGPESPVMLSIPVLYLKSCQSYVRTFIPPAMKKIHMARKTYSSIHDYLFDNPAVLHLYERMIYINMLISQSHGKDKMRKRAAQEKLWEAQCGTFFVSFSGGEGRVSSSRTRQTAYKLLNEAERYLRESGQFVEALTSFDYNCDGFNEYVFQSEHFNAVISPVGGRLCDLNVLTNGANYTDACLSGDRSKAAAFMVETLSEKEPEKFAVSDSDLNWSDALFAERKFDGKRKDILLESECSFSQLKMPVSLQKKIVASSTGFMVQYIVKNLSPFQLRAHFSVSFGFSQTDFSSRKDFQYELELIQDGNRIKPSKDRCILKKGVSMLQISDTGGRMVMLFEPNEEAGFIAETEVLREQEPETRVQNLKFYWPVDLAAGRAMEKTINFMLIPSKKGRND